MDNVDDYVIQFDDASTLFVEIFAQTNFCALALRKFPILSIFVLIFSLLQIFKFKDLWYMAIEKNQG